MALIIRDTGHTTGNHRKSNDLASHVRVQTHPL